MFVVYFFLWLLVLYWVHRVAHKLPVIKNWHWDHHVYIVKNGSSGRQLNNLVLFNDTWTSTLEMYVTEVIPTLLFSAITGQWWIFVFYYVWAAFFQETLEHNKHVNVPVFTSGQWHLIHHRRPNKNYGLLFPIWDILFGTYKRVDK